MLDQALLLEKTTHVLTGTYDFQKLAQQAVDLLYKELKHDGFVGAGVFRVRSENNEIYAYAYNANYKKAADAILPIPFSKMHLTLNAKDNLVVRTIHTNQIQQSARLSDFTMHVTPDRVADQLQKLMRIKQIITIPIATKSGRVAGVLIVPFSTDKISPEQIALIQAFSRQLGLAFSNIFAFERLTQSYKKFDSVPSSEEQIPSIKFTLRLTPRQIKKLEQESKIKKKTKAELIRELIGQ